jgi:ATP-dependent exoDNAse (exonuclease V) beta subunit
VSIRPEADDDAARARILHSLDESLVVEAAAGTGKTTMLVRRIANAIESGRATIDRIVAVTFTYKAAGEMKLRLRQELDGRLANTSNRARIENALAHMEEAFVGTIHSFCAQILRERPVEAAVDPMFQEVAGADVERLFDQAFRAWLEERLAADSPVLRRALVRSFRDWTTPTERLRKAARDLSEWRDHPAPWVRLPWDRNAEIDRLSAFVLEQSKAVKRDAKYQPLHDFATWFSRSEEVQQRDYDLIEARLISLRADLRKAKLDTLQWELEKFRTASDRDLAPALREELLDVLHRFQELKRANGRLDFDDLLRKARDLVRDNADVRRFLHARFSHFFIDEFQDTDALQAELFLLLASDDPNENDWRRTRPAPGRLFIVGDPKQSIYRFRKADMDVYARVVRQVEAGGAGVVRLAKSFRSVPGIQLAVNDAFAPEMTGGDSGQPDYVPLEPFHPPIEGQPSIAMLDFLETRPGEIPRWETIEDRLPKEVARFVDWLKHTSGWRVREGDSLVPIEWRHICILFRRMTSFGRDTSRGYALELEQRGIPHVLIGSKSFHEREEIIAVRAALAAIEWPDDALSVYAVLRGPLFSFSDAELFEYRLTHKLHPFAPRPEAPPEVAATLDFLAELHRFRNDRPLAATVSLLLEAVRAHAVFALRPGGSQVLGNVGRVLDLAREQDSKPGTSFRAFVETLEARALSDESDESPRAEEGAGGVRIMTTHKVKGLEFPIVILADITTQLVREEPDRFIDSQQGLAAVKLLDCLPVELQEEKDAEVARNRAESIRVAYVAATRARDLLVIPALAEKPDRDWWLKPLERVVYSRAFRSNWIRSYQLDADAPPPPAWKTSDLLAPGMHSDPSAAWRESRQAAVERASAPSLSVRTPSVLREPPPEPVPFEAISLSRDPGRPANRRFGLLLHAALRLASPETVPETVRLQGRVLGATPEEFAAAVPAVDLAMRHPLIERARSASKSFREAPLTCRLDDGSVLDGVVDLAYLDGDMWTVVDFKTGEGRPEFENQVRWYAFALHRLTGKPARAVLMEV